MAFYFFRLGFSLTVIKEESMFKNYLYFGITIINMKFY